MSRHRVVIIGSGFGGLMAARSLKRVPRGSQVEITLVSKTTTHLFQPLLYQVATGILSEGDIAPTTRLVLRKQQNVRVLWGEVSAIDLTAKTVTSHLMGIQTVTPYDSLIVAAGAQQSYFGHDEYAAFAPGMKTIDDALELRGRILGAFEAAEVATDPAERQRRLTFVVVGAGPTGVELAGEIVQLAERTLAGAFRTIKPSDCRVILLDAAPAVLPPMGEKLGLIAQRRLEKMDVEIQLNAMVTAVDYMGITIKEKDGGERRIECACKVWAAGVQASPLGKMIADQSDGTETDRAGRVLVEPDLTVKGHPYVFVVGDLMSVPGVPGMAQAAIQGAQYAATIIRHAVKGTDDPATRQPFGYRDKGSMALVSRYSAVAKLGKLEFGGFIAWLAWLLLHLYYLVGYRNRVAALFAWGISFLGRTRGQMAITSQMIYARPLVNWVGQQAGTLAAAESADAAERRAG
jgi:NADH dehydrogenase